MASQGATQALVGAVGVAGVGRAFPAYPALHTGAIGRSTGDSAAARTGAVAVAATEFWKHLPGWYYLFGVLDFLFAELAFAPVKPWHLTPALLFPYLTALVYFYARYTLDGDPQGVRRFLRVAVGSALAVVAVLLLTPTITLGPDAETHYALAKLRHEVVTLGWIPVIAAHCWWNKGPVLFWMFYGAAFLYGAAQETGGIIMGYFGEHGYHWYLPGTSAPAATLFGWSTVFYPTISIFEMLRARFGFFGRMGPWGSAVTVGLVAACFDLHLDGMATHLGLWTWHEAFYAFPGTVYLFDVPFVNFAAWFWAVGTFALFYFHVERRNDWPLKKKVIMMCLLVGVIQGASGLGMFPTMALVEGGIDGPSWQILFKTLKAGPFTPAG